MSLPPGFEPIGTLMLVDLSWWVYRAFHVGGVDSIVSMCTGWLVDLLEEPSPALLAVALDARGPTWRHRRTEGFDPARRYKGHRTPKDEMFYAQAAKVEEIIALHRIPMLQVDGYEADDVIATTARAARELGLTVIVLSQDKDLLQLVSDDWPPVVTWSGPVRSGEVPPAAVREDGVEARWGVRPELLGDLLAVLGDASDNIEGVRGVGKRGALEVLQAHGSLAGAISASIDAGGLDKEISELERARAKARRGGDDSAARTAAERLAEAQARRRLLKTTQRLQAQRDVALLSRELVTLVDDVSLELDFEEMVVGGFDAGRLRPLYKNLMFTRLAEQVRWAPKPALADVMPVDPDVEEVA